MDFDSGKVYVKNIQSFIIPKYFFILYIKNLSKNLDSKDFLDLLIKNSKSDSFYFYKNISPNIKKFKKNSIFSFLNYLNTFGINHIKLNYLSSKKIILEIKNKSINSNYKKNYNLNLILFAFSYNFLSFLYQKKIIFNIKTNEKSTYFIFEFENISKNFDNKDLINFFNYKNPNSSKTFNSLIKKIKINNLLQKNQGSIKIFQIPVLVFPISFYLLFISNNYFSKNLIKKLALEQGNCAVQFQKNFFGFLPNSFLFKEILKQSEVLGVGVINLNLISNSFQIQNNVEEIKNHFRIKNQNFDIYLSNLILGYYQEIFPKISKLQKIENNHFKILTENLLLEENKTTYSKLNLILKS